MPTPQEIAAKIAAIKAQALQTQALAVAPTPSNSVPTVPVLTGEIIPPTSTALAAPLPGSLSLHAGFSRRSQAVARRIICNVTAHTKTGKTHFALNDSPEPVVHFDLNDESEGVVEKFLAQGRDIITYKVRLPSKRGDSPSEIMKQFEPIWDELKLAVYDACQLGQGTIVYDTETDLYELIRLARFGKLAQVQGYQYGPVYAELREMLRWVTETKMSAVYLRKFKPLYNNNVRTDKWEPSGYGDMKYLVQLNLEAQRWDPTPETPEQLAPRFGVTIKDSRSRPDLTGQVYADWQMSVNHLIEVIHGRV